jgi:hypothetical protein
MYRVGGHYVGRAGTAALQLDGFVLVHPEVWCHRHVILVLILLVHIGTVTGTVTMRV